MENYLKDFYKQKIGNELFEHLKSDSRNPVSIPYLKQKAIEYCKDNYVELTQDFEEVDFTHIANICSNHYIAKIVYFKQKPTKEQF